MRRPVQWNYAAGAAHGSQKIYRAKQKAFLLDRKQKRKRQKLYRIIIYYKSVLNHNLDKNDIKKYLHFVEEYGII